MTDVLMPRLSDSMEDDTILKWLVPHEAPVIRGQELVEAAHARDPVRCLATPHSTSQNDGRSCRRQTVSAK
jgi:hypothetical protein